MVAGYSVTSSRQARQNRGTAYPADRLTYKGIGEACPFFGQAVDIGGLHQRMTVTSKYTRCLIICEKEDDIWFSADERKLAKEKLRKMDGFHFDKIMYYKMKFLCRQKNGF